MSTVLLNHSPVFLRSHDIVEAAQQQVHFLPLEVDVDVVTIAHKISHGTNVVDVNNQSANSKKFLLRFDWMLTTTTFVPWDILWAMVM